MSDNHMLPANQPVPHAQDATAELLPPPPEGPKSLADVVSESFAAKVVITVLLAIALLVSFCALRPHYSTVDAWSHEIEVIDAKKSNVLALTTSAVALSASISAIPDDTGTPVAEQLAQMAGNLGIVLAVLYLEKYLLTIFGLVAFGGLVPAACVLFALAMWAHGRLSTGHALYVLGLRLLILAVIAVSVVPASVWVTERIDETYQASSEEAQAAAEAKDTAKASKKSKKSSSKKSENKTIVESLLEGVSNLTTTVTEGLKSVTDDVVSKVTDLIEGAIVMIVTSCVIPILVLAVFLWMGHVLLGIDVSRPSHYLARRLRAPLPNGHGPHAGNGTGTKRMADRTE